MSQRDEAVKAKPKKNSRRVITYIDGFNLYFGLKSKGWKRYYWIVLVRLANAIVHVSGSDSPTALTP